MMAPEVSVIVPVHNAEPFLPPLLDSLQQQSLSAIEFLFVNDGSTDRSGILLDAFAATEPRATVIHHATPRGSATSRNAALAIARGRYIGFADADDLTAPTLYEKLLQHADSGLLDVVYCNAICFNDTPGDSRQTVSCAEKPKGIVTGTAWLVHAWQTRERVSAVWISLVRRSFIESNQLRFPDGIIIDDELWTPAVLLAAQRVAWLNESLYYYRGHLGSTTQTREPAKVRARIDSFAFVAQALYALAESQNRPDVINALRWLAYQNGDAALGLLKRLKIGDGRTTAYRLLQNGGLISRLWQQRPSFRLAKRWGKEWLVSLRSDAK